MVKPKNERLNKTLRISGRLTKGANLPGILQRSFTANYLGIILLVLTLSVGGAGYFTYHALNEVVSSLEVDNRPSTNLLLYKDILVSLQEMDNLTETYQISAEERFKERYAFTSEKIYYLLDSINQLNAQDTELLVFNDSLHSLLYKNKLILDQLLLFTDDPALEELSKLNKITQKIPDIKATHDPEPVESDSVTKEPLFKRIFKKKQAANVKAPPPVNSDSLLNVQKAYIQQAINSQVANIQTKARNLSQSRKTQQITLELVYLDLQSQIIDLIGFLESRENVKIQINALKAKDLTFKTNEQIRIFFILATLLLLSSMVMMVVYVRKNRAYQKLLRESKTATETLSKAKERFFANMSHELRTPMNAISGFTKILMKSGLNAPQREHIEIISKSSEHLLRLLNDILDFSKLQAEKLRLESVPFSIYEVCKESVKLLSESAEKKGLKLHLKMEGLPEAVSGDPHRLRQILLNLISNAIKYTEKGEVFVRVIAQTKGGRYITEFEVIDTGIGIPNDQQSRIFKEFEQADQSSFSKGTGLGLAITKRLIMLHGGDIKLESQEGKGTRVRFSIAYQRSSATIVKEPATKSEPVEGVHILIADDEPFNLKLLSTLLDGWGITHDQATDGNAAWQLASTTRYDIMLVDLKMPGLSGVELSEKIRNSNGPNKKKPIVALTATLTHLEQAHGRFDFILRKPFDEEELFDLISSKTSKPDNGSATDITGLIKMGNKAFVADMIETFITSATTGIAELRSHLRQGHYPNVALIAHRIVAPARHFKAVKLVAQLKTLEKRAENADVTLHDGDISAIETELEHVINSLQLNLQNHLD